MASNPFARFIPNLPDGCIVVRVGAAYAGEFELLGDDIVKASRPSSSAVIIKPADGYTFIYDIQKNTYAAAKAVAPKTVSLTFDVVDPKVAAMVAELAKHPSVVQPEIERAMAGSKLEIVKDAPATGALDEVVTQASSEVNTVVDIVIDQPKNADTI